MRRARIKALAAVPVRKKSGPVTQDVVSDDTGNVSDKEQKKEDTPSSVKTEQEIIKDIANTHEQKEDAFVSDLPAQETFKDVIKTIEETVEKNQDEINVVEREPEAEVVEKQNVASPAKTASPSKTSSSSKTLLPPKIKLAPKRRMVISESARKLAEAKREFLLKHENKTPDRSQLRMYDLIYYNPVTNPMKSTTVQRQETVSQSIERMEEEEEDDPASIPAPQVKVGPDGQLIIDEQSLVIEQTHEKRRREIMESEAIIEDENNHMGGFYKKHKRSKDWPNWETFKFYQVLNVVGTDFLLMQTLFPNRTRQEIKQKYKKEERVNRPLVEKALKYHQEFDTEMLEEQLAMLKNLENVQDASKTVPDKPVQQSRMARKLKNRLVADSIGECEVLSANEEESGEATATNNDDDVPPIKTGNNVEDAQQQIRKESKARKTKEKVKKRVKKKRSKSTDNSSLKTTV